MSGSDDIKHELEESKALVETLLKQLRDKASEDQDAIDKTEEKEAAHARTLEILEKAQNRESVLKAENKKLESWKAVFVKEAAMLEEELGQNEELVEELRAQLAATSTPAPNNNPADGDKSEERIKELTEEITDLESELEAASKVLGTFSAEREGLHKQIAELQSSSSDNNASDSSGEIDNLNTEISSLKQQLESKESELKEAKSANTNKVDGLRAQLSTLEAANVTEIDALKAENDALKSKKPDNTELDTLKADSVAISAERDALKAEVTSLKAKSQDTSEIDSLKAENADLKAQTQDTSECDALKVESATLKAEIDALKTENSSLKASASDHAGDNDALEKLRKENSSLQAEVAPLRASNEKLKANVDRLAGILKDVRAELDLLKDSTPTTASAADDIRKQMMNSNRSQPELSTQVVVTKTPPRPQVVVASSPPKPIPVVIAAPIVANVSQPSQPGDLDLGSVERAYYDGSLHKEWAALVNDSGINMGFVGKMMVDGVDKVLIQRGGEVIFLRDGTTKKLVASVCCQKMKAGFEAKLLCCKKGFPNKDQVLKHMLECAIEYADSLGAALQLMPLDTGYDKGFFFDMGFVNGRAGRVIYSKK